MPKVKIDSEFALSFQDIQKLEELLRKFNIELEIDFEKQILKIEEKNDVFLNEKKNFMKLIQEEINNEYNIALFEQVLISIIFVF